MGRIADEEQWPVSIRVYALARTLCGVGSYKRPIVGGSVTACEEGAESVHFSLHPSPKQLVDGGCFKICHEEVCTGE